ncbi:hypothetical protein BASA62_010065 [Batrachochytrium salamandrivorans]|nr:hypothetical protein BASA62_010065 [Batrachochytrium salamandrivorans]
MRLISFVAISFLAITVSAQPPQDHLYQSLQQSDQAEVEQARLTAAYEKEKAIFSPVNRRLKISMQEITDLKDKMNSIAVKFKETDLDGFLKEQIDTIPKRIEDSLKELEDIKSNEAPLSDNLKYQRDLLTVIVRRLGVQHEIAKDILQKHEQSQTMGGQIMQFFNSYLPNA